jgi:hypothetical protein
MKNRQNLLGALTAVALLFPFLEARSDVKFKCGNHDPADIANTIEDARRLTKAKGCKKWDVFSTTGELTDQQKHQWLARVEGRSSDEMVADTLMGSWKLDYTKSALASGIEKNSRVAYEPTMFGKLKVTVDGADPNGKPVHSEWTGKFDGKDYTVVGDPTADTRSYMVLDDRMIDFLAKKDGRITASGKIILSADGKSRTVKIDAVTPNGKKVKSVSVYNKE